MPVRYPIVSIRHGTQIGPSSHRTGSRPLARTALISVLAMGFLFAAWQVRRSSEVAIFAVASTFALTMIDIVYVVRGTIAPILSRRCRSRSIANRRVGRGFCSARNALTNVLSGRPLTVEFASQRYSVFIGRSYDVTHFAA